MPLPETPAASLAITLFGPMQVWVDSHPLPPMRSRKSLWLSALLTLRPARPVERGWLAGILWPDVEQSQALANLRPVLNGLRNALGSQKERLQSPTRHVLWLNLTGAEVDVFAFDAATKSNNLSELEQAVALYRGPLLEDCLEEWAVQERNTRERECLQALQQLGDTALIARDYTRAGNFYQQAIQIDPLWDTARRGVMEAFAKSGDYNAALQFYREFVELLRSDPRAAPDAQTTALYARLRSEAREQSRSPVVAIAEVAIAPKVTGYLPHSLTGLVGREEERLEVAARLRRSRLVTLTGMGGIGKTRLAIEVAHEIGVEYADGVWLVDLEALSEDKRVLPQIASVLGLKEESGRSLWDSMSRYLCSKQILLVLDNCEHLLAECARISDHLLRECAGLRILATSREALEITGETVWTVPSLAVPIPEHLPRERATLLRALMGYEGVQLFVERAQAVQKTFAITGENAFAVAQMCSQLDGIPLALELAAARMKAMTVAQAVLRLRDNLALLTGGNRFARTRQQTLRATLDWSYALLTVAEQNLLNRLSVFAGGWSMEAAEQVCSGKGIAAGQALDLLTSLVDKSLVIFEEQEGEGGGRYRMLEIVRQYAAEGLQKSGQAQRFRDQHLTWFVAMAEEAAPKLKGSEQAAWLQRLEREYNNLRAALAWSETGTPDAETGLRLTGALWWFWKVRSRFSEGRQYLSTALQREAAQGETMARAKALNGAGALAVNQGDYTLAQAFHEESLAICRKHHERQGIASALNNMANLANHRSDYKTARTLLEESLSIYREADDRQGIATALGNLSGLIRLQGDYTSARILSEKSLSIRRDLGDEQGIALLLANLGNMARLHGDYNTAQRQLEESLDIRRRLRDKHGMAWTLSYLGATADALGNYASARMLIEESLGIRRELGDTHSIAWSLSNLGILALHEGRFPEAKMLFQESRDIFQSLEDRAGIAWSLNHLGDTACQYGEETTARRHLVDSLTLFRELEDKEGIAASLRNLAGVFAVQAEEETAVRLWGAADALRESIGAALLPAEQQNYSQQLERARLSLSPHTFAAAWETGRALTWKQAAASALEVKQLNG